MNWIKNNLILGDYVASIKSKDNGKIHWEISFQGQVIDSSELSSRGFASSEKKAKRFCEKAIDAHLRKREGSYNSGSG